MVRAGIVWSRRFWKAFPHSESMAAGECAGKGAGSGMRLTAAGNLKTMLEQGKDAGKALFGAAPAAGKVHQQCISSQAHHSP